MCGWWGSAWDRPVFLLSWDVRGRHIVHFSEGAGKVDGQNLHGVGSLKDHRQAGFLGVGSQWSCVVGQDSGIRRPLGDVKEEEKWLCRGEEGDSDGDRA